MISETMVITDSVEVYKRDNWYHILAPGRVWTYHASTRVLLPWGAGALGERIMDIPGELQLVIERCMAVRH